MSQVIVPLLYSMPALGVLEFLVGHVVAALLLVSFFRTIASHPGYVPLEYYLEHVQLCLRLALALPSLWLTLFPRLWGAHSSGVQCGVRLYLLHKMQEFLQLCLTRQSAAPTFRSRRAASVISPSHRGTTVIDRRVARACEHSSELPLARTHHCRLCGRCILKMDHHWHAYTF